MPIIIGATSGGVLIPVQVDANGVVIVDQVSALPTGSNLIGKIQANNYGLVGGAAQKDPLRLGYSGDKTEKISDTNADAGTNYLNGATVPAGEIWVLEMACGYNLTKTGVRVDVYAYINSIEIYLLSAFLSANGEIPIWTGALTLSEGDRVYGQFFSCDAGDDIYLHYHARRIDIDQ